MVLHRPAIEPIYGDWSREAALIEAGAMLQLLSEAGTALQLGVCAVGGSDPADLTASLNLKKGQDEVRSLSWPGVSISSKEDLASSRSGLVRLRKYRPSPCIVLWFVFAVIYGSFRFLRWILSVDTEREAGSWGVVGDCGGSGGWVSGIRAEALPGSFLDGSDAFLELVADVLGLRAVGFGDHFFRLEVIRSLTRLVSLIGLVWGVICRSGRCSSIRFWQIWRRFCAQRRGPGVRWLRRRVQRGCRPRPRRRGSGSRTVRDSGLDRPM